MSFGVNDITGAVSGISNINVWDAQGRLKVIGGGTPPPPAPVVWGTITGTVTAQTDLINYLGLNFYPLSSNPAGYITQAAADLLYYPLTSNPSGFITAAALTGYVPTTRTLTINGTSYDLSADRSWTIAAGGTVTSVELAAGTGISLSGTNPITTSGTITVTNDAPDQIVSLATTGTGLSVTGTYPSFTLENTLPDQTVVLTAGTGIGISGTYPSFTIDNTGLISAPDLQQVVNAGNGITNFGGTGNASIQSTNFTNNRTLILNDNAYPTIRLVDNLNAANYLQIDIDTLNIDGVSYNWSSIVNPPTGALVALPFTTDHITATGNPYVIGDVVWYSGNVYRCIANNDSILPTNASYWTSLGAGNPLVQQPSDWNSTSGNNQILNKPTITTYTVDNGLTETPTGNFQLGGPLIQDTDIDGVGSGTYKLNFINLNESVNTARYVFSFATGHAGNNTLLSLDSLANVSRFSHEDGLTNIISAIELTGTELRVQTPLYTTKTIGDVLTLSDPTTGETEWQTPATTTGDSLSPLLLMGG